MGYKLPIRKPTGKKKIAKRKPNPENLARRLEKMAARKAVTRKANANQ
tara:strand:+ start:497 stop:640 length:144 start_codon:yes stop_codon:yes gene_type:complete